MAGASHWHLGHLSLLLYVSSMLVSDIRAIGVWGRIQLANQIESGEASPHRRKAQADAAVCRSGQLLRLRALYPSGLDPELAQHAFMTKSYFRQRCMVGRSHQVALLNAPQPPAAPAPARCQRWQVGTLSVFDPSPLTVSCRQHGRQACQTRLPPTLHA